MKLILALFVLSSFNLSAQTENYSFKKYDELLKKQSHLSNGIDFKTYPITETEFPYYQLSEPVKGSIYYDGDKYNDIYLLYNIVTDELIAEDPTHHNYIQLIKGLITQFEINRHRFIKIENQNKLDNGFYELIFDGPVKVIARYQKSLQHRSSDGVAQPWYQTKNRFYIIKDDLVFTVSSKKNVFRVFYDKKDIIRKELRQRKIKFNTDKGIYSGEAAKLYYKQ